MTKPRLQSLAPRLLSLVLLLGGVGAVAAGVFLTFGLGVMLIVVGLLLIAVEWLVPSR